MNPDNYGVISVTLSRYCVRTKLLLLVIITSVFGCNSQSTTDDFKVIVSDGYYIKTTIDSSPVYLSASHLYGPQRVGAYSHQSIPIENAAEAWKIEGEDTLTITSQNDLVKPLSDLVVHANDGQMQIAIVHDGEASSEFASWRLISLDSGTCHLINVDLGSELVLSVVNPVLLPDGSSRYSVEMVGIDNSLGQKWTIVKFGNSPGRLELEQVCIEE